MTISPTVVHDEHLAAARTEYDGLQGDVQAARDHRQRVRDHRLRTVGRSAAERLELPAVDLASLRTRYLDALQAEQDAGLKTHDAQQRLEQLERARPTVEAGETGSHLAALLQHRGVWGRPGRRGARQPGADHPDVPRDGTRIGHHGRCPGDS